MKKLVLLLLIIPAIVVASQVVPGTLRTNVTIGWNYPTNQLSTNLLFKLYISTNVAIPSTNWTLYTNISGTNLSITLPIQPQQLFFTMTASNFWGEGPFSNVVSTPIPPTNITGLTIQ